jgi:hypothetical protein
MAASSSLTWHRSKSCLDVLKLDPVQVSQEQDVDGVAPDDGL